MSVISATFAVPYSISKSRDAWHFSPRRGTSALFDSLRCLASSQRHTLIGWTGEIQFDKDGGEESSSALSAADKNELRKKLSEDHKSNVIPVWLESERGDPLKDQPRWRRYAEHELYTLFHYKQNEPTDGRDERIWWADYFLVNQTFADRIAECYQPGDSIIVHDYHLMLLPNMIRQRIPDAKVAFFLHIPFPSSELFRCLRRRKEILQGVLGANLAAFQTFGYCRHFESCCKRILRLDASAAGIDVYGAYVALDALPIGIDTDAVTEAAFQDPKVEEKMSEIRKLYGERKIIVGRDRLDTVRGVAQKLQAFERFLELYPQWHDRVVLIQVTSPTSISETEDTAHKISSQISELVARVNTNFGTLSFSPVHHYPKFIGTEEYLALLRVADIALITSVRDGMNTSSLEYIVCQDVTCGQLIISEFSGTAASLSHARTINPWDFRGIAQTIDEALNASAEDRQSQHSKLYSYVTTNNVQAWTKKLLERLDVTVSAFSKAQATPVLDRTRLLGRFKKSRKRLFLFDYDGTLTPIVRDPQAAVPTDRIIRTLKTLASDPKNAVWIISGRDQAFLDEWMGHIPELGLSAEHGSFIRHPMEDGWENVTAHVDMSWQKRAIEVFQHYTEKTQGSFIEKKKVAITWHYRRSDPDFGAHQAQECEEYLRNSLMKEYEVEVMKGKANLEVRPRFVNKGEIAKQLMERYDDDHTATDPTAQGGPDFVLCLGDDHTDEDMFKALKASNLPKESLFACTVGASSKQTAALWHLLEPSDVISTLTLLNGQVDDGLAGSAAVVEGGVPRTRASVG